MKLTTSNLSKIVTIPIKAYNIEKAIEEVTSFKPDVLPNSNCTVAWKRAGSPIFGTEEFTTWCMNVLIKRTKLVSGLGCYVIIDYPKDNIRKNPTYTYNVPNPGIRKYKRVHQIIEVKLENRKKGKEPIIVETGNIVTEQDTLKEAKELAAVLTAETQKDYVIKSVKIADDSIESYCMYWPSKRSKQGTIVFFGVPASRV